MDKYPVFREEQTVGELTVAPDALYTAFSVSCRGREGLWCAWAVGETGNLRIGVLEPENGCREQWEPLRPELLRSPYLRCRLSGFSDVLTCRPERGRLIAVPRDDAAPFPLEAMFCFARSRRLQGRAYWVFRFDDREWPVF